MASDDKRDSKPVHLGMFSRRADGENLSPGDVAAITVSLVWMLVSAGWFIFAPEGANPVPAKITVGLAVLVIFLPVAIFWAAWANLRASRQVTEEAERLNVAVTALRQSYVQKSQSGILELTPAFERKLEEIAAAQRNTEAKLTRFASIRPEVERAAAEERAALAPAKDGQADGDAEAADSQPALELGTPGDVLSPPLSVADFIKALNFPDNAEDKEGFRALRRALQDRSAAQLVQAAQDVLTLLSQDGIYMDDLQPDRARPEIWRRFARGERGKSIAIIGGIRDRSSLALSAGRMRQDTIFRDSVHHFLRKFDHTFSEFEKTASDVEIVALTDTRSARAFMLLGRVTGTFD